MVKSNIVLAGSIAVLFSASAIAQTLAAYTPVTADRLLNPEPHNWLMYRGTYDSHGYSSLAQINNGNVDELEMVWSFSTGLREGHQAPP
ncbi:MAG: hypothetical protein WD772_00995, partial [Pseudohongiellaceae bacterium]